MCCIVYRSNQTARFNESRSKALTDFYVGFQTIISRLDQNGIFYLDIGNGRKIVKDVNSFNSEEEVMNNTVTTSNVLK
ncbi:MAG TPA: hypothetical protein VFD60_07535 [Nitrososphaeraceae archaeon]|jgi:hypothetical protein|nr:hypothetical protein [Nitrososphaeraceae archaeon]